MTHAYNILQGYAYSIFLSILEQSPARSTFGKALVALVDLRARRSGHDPGQVAWTWPVVIADGGQVINDVRTLADQHLLHGQVPRSRCAAGAGRHR